MKLQVIRQQYRPNSTVGHMLVDGTFECFTLEDGVRTNKVMGETCIPPGTYRMTVEHSPAFKQRLPRLHNVPNFQGVLIHTGNTPANTRGCILVGAGWKQGQETITQSRVAFDVLFRKINDALARGESLEIEVVQENAPADLLARAVRPMRGGAKPKAKPKAKAKPRAKAKPKAGARPKAKRKAAPKKKKKSAARRR